MMKRYLPQLTAPEVREKLNGNSILCLPIGAIEQHGPHLPLNTDAVLAEEYTKRFIERWGDEFDLWMLPPIMFGLSREHAWADGTISMSVQGFSTLLHEVVRECASAFPARRMAIINGNGGNRGILEAVIYELERDYGLHVCVLHPSALSKTSSNSIVPEVHGGKSETSVMIVLAPDLVRKDLLERMPSADLDQETRDYVLDRGVTWAWRSNDPRLGSEGIIGDARAASRELGLEIVENAVANAGEVFRKLKSRVHQER